MPQRPVSLTAPRGSVAADVVREGIDALLAPAADDMPLDFPAEVLAEAEQAAARSLRRPPTASRRLSGRTAPRCPS